MKRFRFRAFLSLTLFFSFFLAFLSGVALYLRPEGSIARWTDWRLFGLDKKGWEGVHTQSCILMVGVVIFHLALNWKALIHYLRKKTTRGFSLRWELPASLLLVAGGLFLAVGHWPPLSKMMEWRGNIKDGAGLVLIEAPEGDFENQSLEKVAAYLKSTVDRVVIPLRSQGIIILSPEDTLKDVARRNRLSPQDLYGRILDVVKEEERD